jgi:RNA polymerase sigma-70 factor (ECF subfamily)
MHPQPCEPDEIRADLPAPDASFEALFRDHFGFVYQNLRRLGVPPASVEDAVQEVFLVVLRRQDAPVTTIRGWLFGIVRRIAWRQRRSAGRQSRLAEALAEQTRPALDGVHAIAEREAATLLERFLGRLDDDKRAVFLLAELEQMTAPEIARALAVKENTVYSRLRAARQEFDRTFARVRLRERRATGEAALDERALLLSRARRAHEPSPAARQRVLLLLWAPAGAATLGSAGEAAASPGAPGHASAWTHEPARLSTKLAAKKFSGGITAKLAGGGHTAWAVAIGTVGIAAILARPTPAPGEPRPDRGAPIEAVARDMDRGVPAASASDTAPADEPSLPFARLTAAAARAGQPAPSRPAPRRPETTANVPKDMSETPATDSPAATPVAAAPLDAGALRREAALMADARAALRSDAWARARELLQRHALEFPAGALVDERRLSLITALCSMGQVEAARAEAARIAAEQPGSVVARKANVMCPANSSTGAGRSGD